MNGPEKTLGASLIKLTQQPRDLKTVLSEFFAEDIYTCPDFKLNKRKFCQLRFTVFRARRYDGKDENVTEEEKPSG